MGNKSSKNKKSVSDKTKKKETPGNYQIQIDKKTLCKNYSKTPSKLTERSYIKNQEEFNKEKIDIKNLLEKYENYRKNFFNKNTQKELIFEEDKEKAKSKNLLKFENFLKPLLNDENKSVFKKFLEKEKEHWDFCNLNSGIVHYEWSNWTVLLNNYLEENK